MNRQESRVCLLDVDVMQQVQEMEVESSSSGYESCVSSDDEIRTCTRTTGSALPSVSTSFSTASTPKEIMLFTSSGGLHDSLALITSMPELCDVTFLVGKERVPVHGVKAILATRSRCLYQLILYHQRKTECSKGKPKKSSSSFVPRKLTIDVTDYQPNDFKKFVIFVHSGKVKVDVSSVIGLLCAASEFGFRDLRVACLDFIHRCKDQRQRDIILDSAWTYQHKKSAQKLICQLSGVIR